MTITLTSDIGGIILLIILFMFIAAPWIVGGGVAGCLASVWVRSPLTAALVSLLVSTASFWASLFATLIIAADSHLVWADLQRLFAGVAVAAVLLAVPWYLLEALLIWAHKRSGVSLWSEAPVEPRPVVTSK